MTARHFDRPRVIDSAPTESPIKMLARNSVQLAISLHGVPREIRVNPADVGHVKALAGLVDVSKTLPYGTLPVITDDEVPTGELRVLCHEVPLWWVSWNQATHRGHRVDSRPVMWPPPAPVLAFWEVGARHPGQADEAFSIVVAIVRARSESDVEICIDWGWNPGVTKLPVRRPHADSAAARGVSAAAVVGGARPLAVVGAEPARGRECLREPSRRRDLVVSLCLMLAAGIVTVGHAWIVPRADDAANILAHVGLTMFGSVCVWRAFKRVMRSAR